VVLDVGCGDGLLAFAALDRTAPSGHAIFSDVSEELLEECRRLAAESGAAARCDFIRSALPRLAEIRDEAVDVVVLRSVLIYVKDKQRAFENLARVLRPGGRLSLFEPINGFGLPEPAARLWGLDVTGLEPLAEEVKATVDGYIPSDSPMLDFDERDLLRWAEQAGFDNLQLTFEAHLGGTHRAAGQSIDAFLSQSPNPNMPTLSQVLRESLSPHERQLLEERFAQRLASGTGRTTRASAFLTGVATG
jgi:ubiquinone/menaquinone biosynthesis C-methylase UbiE